MNTDKLSERLAAVTKYIPNGCRMADIGSDHAYLPCHMVKKGAVSFAIAGEVAEGPFQTALRQVRSEGLTDSIEVRKGNGLEVISFGEVDCITIAGMGGALITSILDSGKDKLEGVKKLVLQPNVGAAAIRRWLLVNGWELVSEAILQEEGKIYEILAAERGTVMKPYSDRFKAEILFGPFLVTERNEAFREKWEQEKLNWLNILHQLEGAGQNVGTAKKMQEITDKIKMVEEVLS